MIQSVQMGGMLVGPIFAGFVYDATESYVIAFLGFAAAGFLATLLMVGVRKPKKTARVAMTA